jgi:hypothetical protein
MSDELNNIDDVEEITLEEDAAASNQATIAMKPTGISRSDLISKMVAYASQLGKEDLSQAIEKMGIPEPEEIFNNNTNLATGDMSAKNKATIRSSNAKGDPMQSVKEDLNLLFGDSTDLSEDFRIKVGTLFEAAVSTRVGIENARLEEEFEEKLEESYIEIKEDMMSNIDAYLNYAVAEWASDNRLAIENNIRAQVTESFINGLKGLFEEHYVEIPEDKVDVVESLAMRIEELETLVNETTADNIELTKLVNEKEVREISDSLTEGMTSVQKDKFVKLTEAVSYSDANEFRKKANVIKETYFAGKSDIKVVEDRLLSESVEEPEMNKSNSNMDSSMQMYVSNLSKTIKK